MLGALVGCAAAHEAATPAAHVGAPGTTPSGSGPASVDLIFDVEQGAAARAAPIFARRLEAAGARADVAAIDRGTIRVRLYEGEPALVVRLASVGEVLAAPIDDAFDLAETSDAPPPASVEVAVERVSHPGGGRGRYLRCAPPDAPALLTWLGGARLPPDRVALVGDDDNPDEPPHVRTFVILRDALVSTGDIVEVSKGDDAAGTFLTVRIGDEASRRLEAYTRAHVRQRLAFVAGGRVMTAPVVMSPIATRELRLSVGAVPDARQRADRIAAALTAGAIPSPLHLRTPLK